MRPPESFCTAAAKLLAQVSGMSWMVGVEIFITKGGCCACAAPSVNASDKRYTAAATPARVARWRFMERMLPSLRAGSPVANVIFLFLRTAAPDEARFFARESIYYVN